MDLSNPLRVVTPTLDAAVLLALTGTSASATGAHVHRMAGTGSPDGVRRVLARLVTQGIVLADEHANATLYRLNRDHVAADLVIALARLRVRIVTLISDTIAAWECQPKHASIFGSFARNEADEDSDIDLLIIADDFVTDDRWISQIDDLSQRILISTGNQAQIIEATPARLVEMAVAADPLLDSWRSRSIHLAGDPLQDVLRTMWTDAGLSLSGWR